MQLEKRTIVDRIEILASGLIQVRTAVQVVQTNDDGSEEIIAATFSRDTAEPGDTAKAKTLLADKSQISDLIWTPLVVQKYQAVKAAQQNPKQVEANAELSQAG